MAKVLRTRVKPGSQVAHKCRDINGRSMTGRAQSNSLCSKCNTQIVYVWGNTPVEQ